MKRVYLMLLVSLMTLAFSTLPAMAGTLPEETYVTLSYGPAFMYEQKTDVLGDYYMLMSEVPATYNSATGAISMESAGWCVSADLYGATSGNPILVPVGKYKKGDGSEAFTYDAEYTVVQYMDATGGSTGLQVDSIEVNRPEGTGTQVIIYASANGVTYEFTYYGTPSFSGGGSSTTHTLAQITNDVKTTFTHCHPYYYGNLYESETGNMMLYLYDGEHDETYGTQSGEGYMVALNTFATLFSKPADAYVKPGTYTMAKNFKQYTYYPGTEVNYMGSTQIIGCLAQHRDADGAYTYACITSGTITIESDDVGKYTITVDMMTDTGYKIQGTFSGELEDLVDKSDDTSSKAIVSTLTDDYVMDLKQIPVARLYKEENCANCCHYVLDIGSVSGKDQCLVDNGGDYFRMDFLTSVDQTGVPTGKFEAITEYYQGYVTNYEPGRFVWGHFENGGDLVGTRWGQFANGRYLVMVGLAPIVKGEFTITKNEGNTYTVDIAGIDDAKYHVDGTWTGPIELQFDETDGIEDLTDFESGTKSQQLYDLSGRKIAGDVKGVYIMNGKKIVR